MRFKNSACPGIDVPIYDLVVSNPPFRRLKSGLLNIEEEKAIARHEIKLSLHEFIAAAASLLRAKGRLCLIYHPSRLAELIDALRKKGVEPKRLRFVHSTISSESKMVLLEAVKGGRMDLKVEKPLYIYKEDGRLYRRDEGYIWNVLGDFVDHLKDLLTYLTVEKGLSRNTTESYQFDLRKFQDFLSSKDKGFDSFTKADIIDFLEKAREVKITPFRVSAGSYRP